MQKLRARKVITRGPIRVVGKFPSIKSGRMHHWESQLERDRMYQLELDPEVIRFREQPMTLEVSVNGHLHRYTPDLEVQTTHEPLIEEIKPADKVEAHADLFEAVSEFLADEGIAFRVVTDNEIRREPHLSNIKQLLPYRLAAIDIAELEFSAQLFSSCSGLTFGDLQNAFGGTTAFQPWALLAQGFVATDLEQSITPESPVQFTQGATPCPQFS